MTNPVAIIIIIITRTDPEISRTTVETANKTTSMGVAITRTSSKTSLETRRPTCLTIMIWEASMNPTYWTITLLCRTREDAMNLRTNPLMIWTATSWMAPL